MAEEDPWGFDDGDADFTAEPTAAEAVAGEAAVAGGGEVPGVPEGRPVMDVPGMDEGSYRKPLTLYKHWVRWVHLF